jgi:hypothetical protein
MILAILSKYPDAGLLLNNQDRRFMVLLRNSGGLLVGTFDDDYYPRLDYVGDGESTSVRRAAVTRLQKRLPMYQYCAALKRNRGWTISSSVNLNCLIGGALFLNKIQIAKATVFNPQPNGYFSAKILEKVLQGGDRRAGIQSLTFVAADATDRGDGQKMSYEILFDYSRQYFDENNRKEFAGAILNLEEFICGIEDYFRFDCPNRGNSIESNDWLRENAEIIAKTWLDSPDRNEYQFAGKIPFKFDGYPDECPFWED